MQAIRNLSLALTVLFVAGCSSFTSENSPDLPRNAQWGIVPMINYSQTPQAGERSEQILLSVLSSHGLQPRVYPTSTQGEQALMDDNERLTGALEWAREQKLDYGCRPGTNGVAVGHQYGACARYGNHRHGHWNHHSGCQLRSQC